MLYTYALLIFVTGLSPNETEIESSNAFGPFNVRVQSYSSIDLIV